MYRTDLLHLLLEHPLTVNQMALLLDAPPRDVEQDLRHLFRSLKRTEYAPVVDGARCRHCGFAFKGDKLRRPGKCPRCRSTWISDPLLAIHHAI